MPNTANQFSEFSRNASKQLNFVMHVKNKVKTLLETNIKYKYEKVQEIQIKEIINKLKTRKAPRKDFIANKIIKNLPKKAIDKLTNIINLKIIHQNFPTL